MKVLQTLGKHRSKQVGVLQYKRTPTVVEFEGLAGSARRAGNFSLTNGEWNQILTAIQASPQGTFRLTPRAATVTTPPNQDLYTLISAAVSVPAAGWTWNDSRKAAVCAVLEHEGSIDLYHGTIGRGVPPAFVALARDI
jgi:hypothetical protein